MALLDQADVYVVVKVNRQTKFGMFSTAMYFTPQEFQNLTQQQLVNRVAARIKQWVDRRQQQVDVPDPVVAPTPSEKAAYIAELQQRKLEIDQEIAKLNS